MCVVWKINSCSSWKAKIPQYLYYFLLCTGEINPSFFRARIHDTFLSKMLFPEDVFQPCMYRKWEQWGGFLVLGLVLIFLRVTGRLVPKSNLPTLLFQLIKERDEYLAWSISRPQSLFFSLTGPVTSQKFRLNVTSMTLSAPSDWQRRNQQEKTLCCPLGKIWDK